MCTNVDKLHTAVLSFEGSPSDLRRVLEETGLDVSTPGEGGYTALHYAAMADWNESEDGRTRLLLELGADTEARAETQGIPGCTPLMLAASEGFAAQVRTLINYGADINAQDRLGRTPLMHALDSGLDVLTKVQLLLDAGADIRIKDSKGWMALDHARSHFRVLNAIDPACPYKSTEIPDLLDPKGDDYDDVRSQTRLEREQLINRTKQDMAKVIAILSKNTSRKKPFLLRFIHRLARLFGGAG